MDKYEEMIERLSELIAESGKRWDIAFDKKDELLMTVETAIENSLWALRNEYQDKVENLMLTMVEYYGA